MKISFLGTGTSYGVPFIACDCAVCQSTDPHNKRLRASILVDVEGESAAENGASSTRILIDTTPDLRQQMLRENVRYLSAVCWTHWHNDHIIGLDDLRPISDRVGYVQGFADETTCENLRRVFGYALQENRETGGVPRIKLRALKMSLVQRTPIRRLLKRTPRIVLQKASPLQILEIGDIRVTPIPILHGKNPIFAYRFESENRVLVYATDCSRIPDESRALMCNADVLVLGALRHQPHPAHFSLSEALQEAESLHAKRAFFTHIGHDLDHEETNATLPQNVRLAYDGLSIEI